ncbi:adenylate/guanylate cyclase domain-containing protein [Bradyrhizobium sp. CCBAU 51627]|uniref:adenylate/guanylate cyclase domain-containing protein n=1 Tax=Bradyrhizobium sp. CCBAU 51627 TaxID=1325088 RepID=UPI00230565E0|nr:tetratricopeptide repeat protein [Bradyrhizobium sp. CCBAU 51627]MDA9435155.1 adenylate cyclase [Bradyrhizobium sp. CCBAU 51627]
MERRLTAVVCADVVGYSKMMGADEAGTLASLKAHRAALDPVILNHGGRIVKTTGDGLLLEFPSVVGAVTAGIEAQQLMASRNAQLPDDRRMRFRIGVHMGDVIVDEDDLFGDGVNIAARIEPLAPPGGIAISEKAHTEVRGHIDAAFDDAGVHSLKNIEQPTKVWSWSPETSAGPVAPASKTSETKPRGAVAVVGVLPFENHSDNKEDEYFSDGMTEDLINALSRQDVFRILSRHSTFRFKGKHDVRLIARELDATYIVRGSVRRAGNTVRVTAELVAPETGEQLWSERFDRDLNDLFAIQDEITTDLAACIAPEIDKVETKTHARLTSAELSAWDCYLKGLFHWYAASSSDFQLAAAWFRKAIEHDPTLAEAKGWLAIVLVHSVQVGITRSTRELWSEALQLTQQAVRLDPRSPMAFAAFAFVNAFAGNQDAAIEAGRHAVELNVHDSTVRGVLGQCYFTAGDHVRALEMFSTALRMSPNNHEAYHWAAMSAFGHFLLGNHDAALSWARKALYGNPDHLQVLGVRAAALAELGRSVEAAKAAEEFLAHAPGLTIERHLRNFRWKNPADIAHYRDGLARAGVPMK